MIFRFHPLLSGGGRDEAGGGGSYLHGTEIDMAGSSDFHRSKDDTSSMMTAGGGAGRYRLPLVSSHFTGMASPSDDSSNSFMMTTGEEGGGAGHHNRPVRGHVSNNTDSTGPSNSNSRAVMTTATAAGGGGGGGGLGYQKPSVINQASASSITTRINSGSSLTREEKGERPSFLKSSNHLTHDTSGPPSVSASSSGQPPFLIDFNALPQDSITAAMRSLCTDGLDNHMDWR